MYLSLIFLGAVVVASAWPSSGNYETLREEGLNTAMKYKNSTLPCNSRHITIGDILELHKSVLGAEGGWFRSVQVHVGDHIPPPSSEIQSLVSQFLDWLNSEDALGLHPLTYAALAHYKLVYIHPFMDGNGRTSRLLMNLLLKRSGFPPVMIPKQYRHEYAQLLQTANEGDVTPFVSFIALCAERSLNGSLWVTSLEEPIKNHKVFIIPDGHCSGYLLKRDNYDCTWSWETVNTLRVSVDDTDASPDIEFRDNLKEVLIWRKGSCIGDSLVKVGWTCGVKDLPGTCTSPLKTDKHIKDPRIIGPIPNYQPAWGVEKYNRLA